MKFTDKEIQAWLQGKNVMSGKRLEPTRDELYEWATQQRQSNRANGVWEYLGAFRKIEQTERPFVIEMAALLHRDHVEQSDMSAGAVSGFMRALRLSIGQPRVSIYKSLAEKYNEYTIEGKVREKDADYNRT